MQENPGIIIVAGGIGCGKSVVCHILEALGYAVYDCDSRAKAIMDCNREIIDRIASD
ncbi:MAG: dephospho-CoA kinase, partial [Muribaculaceae bacterium]|nr:dephospho-CoA kinase [Muribaculaceae bacterium]